MGDKTVYAEALISTVARAIYDDDVVCLIDVLLRDRFLRDDDMGPRLSLPAKKLRITMQFLQDEQLVKYELVDDLATGGSQASKYWYIDIHHAVNVIRYRIFLLKQKLDQDELIARSSSMYLCPGYKSKTCNGRYTEAEAQQIVDPTRGHFLCQECFSNHRNNPEPPGLETYTLQLVDNTKALKQAEENIRRVRVQLNGKRIGYQQLRVGIYDLLYKIKMGKGTLSSNLPSENKEKGIGTERLAGTGRTAHSKAKRNKLLEAQGKGEQKNERANNFNFLKNAKGEDIWFEFEKGSGARANLLATRSRRKSKLMDAAASRVGAGLSFLEKTIQATKKVAEKEEDKDKDEKSKKKTKDVRSLPSLPFFLKYRIGTDLSAHRYGKKRSLDEMKLTDTQMSDSDNDDESDDDDEYMHDMGELRKMSLEERRTYFQRNYKIEMARQKKLSAAQNQALLLSDDNSETDGDIVTWEDG